MTIRRRRTLTAAGALLAVGAVAYFATRLPTGPDVVWARILPTLGGKPFADVRDAPNGTPVARANAWFWPADDASWPSSDRWDESLHVVLDCEMPFVRSAIAYASGRQHQWSRFAEYRASSTRVAIGKDTWLRYVSID